MEHKNNHENVYKTKNKNTNLKNLTVNKATNLKNISPSWKSFSKNMAISSK